jgi:ABC-type phosphate transport system substrate-binding protein
MIKTLVAAAAAAATVAALTAPALADPVSPHTGKAVTPSQWDIVGVGSQTIAFVNDQLAYNYDKGIKHDTTKTPYVYYWDATPPSNPASTAAQRVTLKTGCKNIRPNGSSAGKTALETYGHVKYKGTSYPCVSFAGSSSGRNSTTSPVDPACSTGGICFVKLANDVVTYATTKNSNAPSDLTQAQLAEIFGCTIPAAHGFAKGTWGALLGAKAKDPKGSPDPLVPQSGAGTLKFWMETALGLPTDTEPACGSLAGVTKKNFQPEENEGLSKLFLLKNGKPNPNVLYPYSIAAYVAQEAHSAKLHHKPGKGQNQFGVDETGVLFLNGIKVGTKNIAATVTVKKLPVINPAWNATVFRRYVYDVVLFSNARGSLNDIPANEVKIFGPKGYWCTHNSVLADYGFEPIGSLCGSSS